MSLLPASRYSCLYVFRSAGILRPTYLIDRVEPGQIVLEIGSVEHEHKVLAAQAVYVQVIQRRAILSNHVAVAHTERRTRERGGVRLWRNGVQVLQYEWLSEQRGNGAPVRDNETRNVQKSSHQCLSFLFYPLLCPLRLHVRVWAGGQPLHIHDCGLFFSTIPHLYCPSLSTRRAAVLARVVSRKASALGPRTLTALMCDTSNKAAEFLTARCYEAQHTRATMTGTTKFMIRIEKAARFEK